MSNFSSRGPPPPYEPYNVSDNLPDAPPVISFHNVDINNNNNNNNSNNNSNNNNSNNNNNNLSDYGSGVHGKDLADGYHAIFASMVNDQSSTSLMSSLYDTLFTCLSQAATFETKHDFELSRQKYLDATSTLQKLINIEKDSNKKQLLMTKYKEYEVKINDLTERASEQLTLRLQRQYKVNTNNNNSSNSSTGNQKPKENPESTRILQQANNLIQQSLTHQQNGPQFYQAALDCSLQSISLYLSLLSSMPNLKSKVVTLMDDAEKLKSLIASYSNNNDKNNNNNNNNNTNNNMVSSNSNVNSNKEKKSVSIDNAFPTLPTHHPSLQASQNPPNKSPSPPPNKSPAQSGVNPSVSAALPVPSKSKKPPQLQKNKSRLNVVEIRILKCKSRINGILCMPYLPEIDDEGANFCKNNNNNNSKYEDPDGLIPLSKKQQEKLSRWARPGDIVANKSPVMILEVSPEPITQTLITNCSFICSLAVTANYEKKFSKQLITSIIYPKHPTTNLPMMNPFGKYMIILFINGCKRKVFIDDRLPVDSNNNLLCSFSNKHNTNDSNGTEFWVSLIEKAFLKVCGGYDFLGSNSSIDLHMLTGWVPEEIKIKRKIVSVSGGSRPEDVTFDTEKWWVKIRDGSDLGQCLITIGTGEMSDDMSDKLGLVSCHAYAILDVREVDKKRFCLIKNPWCHLRFKGRYSADDSVNWTPNLKKALNYDSLTERRNDNGMFWMLWEDVVQYYATLCLNWNPHIFQQRQSIHSAWLMDESEMEDGGGISCGGGGVIECSSRKNDGYCYADNPQFSLDIQFTPESSASASVWVLLSKHHTVKGENKDYITCHIYGNGVPNNTVSSSDDSDKNAKESTKDKKPLNENRGGYRIYYPCEPMIRGTYINTIHHLVRFAADKGNNNKFTIVVSQYEREFGISFSITTYSTHPFTFTQLPSSYPYEQRIVSEWTKETSGGSSWQNTYSSNPQFLLTVARETSVRMMLEAPKSFPSCLRLYSLSGSRESGSNVSGGGSRRVLTHDKSKLVLDTGDYRYGFSMCERGPCTGNGNASEVLPAGLYTLVVSCWEPGQTGPFVLRVGLSATPVNLIPLPL